MSSSSQSNGTVQIQVTFDIGTNVDYRGGQRQQPRQAGRAAPARGSAPAGRDRRARQLRRSCRCSRSTRPTGATTICSRRNYVTLNVLDQLKRLPGTTNVQIFGAKDYAMRIWLKPDRLAQLKLTPADVITAVNEQNAQFAAGKIGQSPIGEQPGPRLHDHDAGTPHRCQASSSRSSSAPIPTARSCGWRDVARVELGSRDYEFIGRYNGKPATLVGIFLPPGANALEVAKSVKVDDGRDRAALSRRPDLRDPVRHDALRRGVDPRGDEDAGRGDGAGVPGRVPVPAELARRADSRSPRCRSR